MLVSEVVCFGSVCVRHKNTGSMLVDPTDFFITSLSAEEVSRRGVCVWFGGQDMRWQRHGSGALCQGVKFYLSGNNNTLSIVSATEKAPVSNWMIVDTYNVNQVKPKEQRWLQPRCDYLSAAGFELAACERSNNNKCRPVTYTNSGDSLRAPHWGFDRLSVLLMV